MKKFPIICILVLFSVQFVSAQKTDTGATPSAHAAYDLYMQKHRTNNTIAWVLLTGGVVATTVGTLSAIANVNNLGASNYDGSKGEVLTYAGLAVALGSIPFFIAGHANKKKARMSLKNENVSIVGRNNFNYPAVSFKIQF